MAQFINAKDFDPSSLVIGNALPQTNGTHRCVIKYNYRDGSCGPLLICTPKLFSFGVCAQAPIGEAVKDDMSNVYGYVLPLCLCDNSNVVKPEEEDLMRTIEMIPDLIKEHCTTTEFNAEIGKYGEEKFTVSDFKKLTPIYRKKEKGVIVPGKSPMLYPKLKWKKSDGTFATVFNKNDDAYTSDTGVNIESVNPTGLCNKRMNVKCQLHIESIFVGSKISLQVKLSQVLFDCIENTQCRIPGF